MPLQRTDLLADRRLPDAFLAPHGGKATAFDHPYKHSDRGDLIHGQVPCSCPPPHYAAYRNRFYSDWSSTGRPRELIGQCDQSRRQASDPFQHPRTGVGLHRRNQQFRYRSTHGDLRRRCARQRSSQRIRYPGRDPELGAARDRWGSKGYKETIASDASGWLFIVASTRNAVTKSRMGGKLVFRIYAICLRCNRRPESTSNVGVQSKGPPPGQPQESGAAERLLHAFL